MIYLAIGWLIACSVVSGLARERDINYGEALVLCLVLSPILGFFYIISFPLKDEVERSNKIVKLLESIESELVKKS